jgi:hypothetical protein
VFGHRASDTLFVFRPRKSSEPVASHNLLDVRRMLDARGFMSGDTFENQFKKPPCVTAGFRILAGVNRLWTAGWPVKNTLSGTFPGTDDPPARQRRSCALS